MSLLAITQTVGKVGIVKTVKLLYSVIKETTHVLKDKVNMPRKQPPDGYITAGEAAALLKVTDAMLTKYVKQNRLHRYGPEERKHKFYKLSEVQKIIDADTAFFGLEAKTEEEVDAMFALAQPEDMEGIDILAVRLFKRRSIGADRRRSWLTKESHGNYVMKRKSDGKIVAYCYVQPFAHDMIVDYLHRKIRGWQITEDHIVQLAPGIPTECFIGAVGTDPDLSEVLRTAYMAMLLRGIRYDLEQLGRAGITISKLYAASSNFDGIMMCLRLGMHEWEPPKQKRATFVLDVEQSDNWLFQPYKRALEEWRREHPPAECN